MKKVKDYLAPFATAQATFKVLHAEALALLPEAQPLKATPEPVEAIVAVAELARRLKVSSTTVRRELSRLRNYGWISDEGDRKYRLGTRVGARVTLMADVQAQEATGAVTLVSREVLGIEDPMGAQMPLLAPPPSRGQAREWER